jgi:hypothetical protein
LLVAVKIVQTATRISPPLQSHGAECSTHRRARKRGAQDLAKIEEFQVV